MSSQAKKINTSNHAAGCNLETYLAVRAAVGATVFAEINPDGTLTPCLIRMLLRINGVDVSKLAKQHGYSDTRFHQVITRNRKGTKIRQIIADALEMPCAYVWGEAADGK